MPDSQQSKKAEAITQTDEQLSNQMLADTINISLKYGDEYMDENLVTGQPGGFHLSKTGKKDQEKGKLAVPALAKPAASSKPVPPPALKTDIPPPAKKGIKVEKSPKTPGVPKPKRRKSKANVSAGGNASPT
jgi:mediator of RNA polymerase II transcription subunit 6